MSTKRIDAKAIRERAEFAQVEAEARAAEYLKIAKRRKKIVSAMARQTLQAACEGLQCVRLKSDSFEGLSNLMTSYGFDVVGVGYVKKKHLESQKVAQSHKIAIERTIEESAELQAFLRQNQASGSVSSPIGKLMQMLDKAFRSWAAEGYVRNRAFFTKFLCDKRHWVNGVGSTPERGVFDCLEEVWVEYVWYVPAAAEAKAFKEDLKAVGKAAFETEIFAVWHNSAAAIEDFDNLMPTCGFLKWLSESSGQHLLNRVDSQINDSAELGETETSVAISKRGERFFWLFGGETLPGPSPAAFAKIMSLRGFKSHISSDGAISFTW
jgi:hypothetical protein